MFECRGAQYVDRGPRRALTPPPPPGADGNVTLACLQNLRALTMTCFIINTNLYCIVL